MDKLNDLQRFIQIDIRPENIKDEQLIKKLQQQWELLWQLQVNTVFKCVEPDTDFSDRNYGQPIDLLVFLNNQVHEYLHKNAALWRCHPIANVVKKFYKEMLNSFSLLIQTLLKDDCHYHHNVAFTNQEREFAVPLLMRRFRLLETHFKLFEIDPSLSELVLRNIFYAIRKSPLTRSSDGYLADLMTHLLRSDLNTSLVINSLYLFDFNVPEFFMYWINSWDESLMSEPGLHEQLELLIREQARLQQIGFRKNHKFLSTEESLKTELNEFLREKKQIVSDLIKLRRAKLKDDQLAKMITRIRTTLPVAQLALFIRLQIEKGILAKEHVGRIFGFYATHFYNTQTEHISAESLQRKSTNIEYATAQKFKGVLIGMINWLNEHFKFES